VIARSIRERFAVPTPPTLSGRTDEVALEIKPYMQPFERDLAVRDQRRDSRGAWLPRLGRIHPGGLFHLLPGIRGPGTRRYGPIPEGFAGSMGSVGASGIPAPIPGYAFRGGFPASPPGDLGPAAAGESGGALVLKRGNSAKTKAWTCHRLACR